MGKGEDFFRGFFCPDNHRIVRDLVCVHARFKLQAVRYQRKLINY